MHYEFAFELRSSGTLLNNQGNVLKQPPELFYIKICS